MAKRKELPIIWDVHPLPADRAKRLLRYLLSTNTKPAAQSCQTHTQRASERGSERAAG